MAKMMTGGEMAPKKQGKIGEAIDRMRIGRKAKLEARSGAAADQGNAVKAKRLSNRAEKVGNRMELKAVKKGGVLPAGKKIGEYIGKGISSSAVDPMRKNEEQRFSNGKSILQEKQEMQEEMKKIMSDEKQEIPDELNKPLGQRRESYTTPPEVKERIRSRRLGKSMSMKGQIWQEKH